ncbi:FecR family protein [Chitinophaga barathri]|uniref:DUF4974 domain-containing protein n=1 Tax=Chitinophaga barathri TaxID=1647451 RepID=A0A3N4MM74_9BACT|nr:FecR domain-containing protein [Chitinophaga barathri]RPD43107.1 DUF4974 domain-containing protein [Chitinophaga barathri]
MKESRNNRMEIPTAILMKHIGGAPEEPLSEEEKTILVVWLAESDSNRQLFKDVLNGHSLLDDAAYVINTRDQEWKKMQQRLSPARRMFSFVRLSAAAAILVLLGVAVFYMVGKLEHRADMAQMPVMPAKDVATLTLADGREVALGNNSGIVAHQGGLVVSNDTTGELSYLGAEGSQRSAEYNTLRTPRGGKYAVRLPDGTRVWLNAQSSIRYPANFGQATRNVSIEGEAYFEVAKDPQRPFRVEVPTTIGKMQVDVLGTHFNINAYAERGLIKTTLLEGSVRISKGSQVRELVPGQQSMVARQGDQIETAQVRNLADVVAWKEGYFVYNGEQLGEVANDIARRYDLEVELDEQHAKVAVLFTAGDPDIPLDSLISLLQNASLKVRREGRTLIVGK